MVVSHATIHSNVFTDINLVLKSLFLTKNIYAKFPEDSTKIKKSDYPLIVQTMADVNQIDKKFGRGTSTKEINVFVELYSNNPSDIDSYSDTIHNYFENNTLSNLHIPAVNDSSQDTLQINDQVVSFRIINLSFKFL